VKDVRQPVTGLIVHVGKVQHGEPKLQDKVWVEVDVERRKDIMRNHTATHLLHRGLRQVLGSHVQQAGSLVAPDRLRFDFTHHTMVTEDELDRIAQSANQAILGDYPVKVTHEPYEQALESGVIALFGEKYGDVVRVIRIGDNQDPISQELCGGTHVSATGEIGQLQLISEGSIGAGLRRIEAVTGRVATQWVSDELGILKDAARQLECPPNEVADKVSALLQEAQAARKQVARLQEQLARQEFERLLSQAQQVADVMLLSARLTATPVERMRQMTDWFRDRYASSVVVLGSVNDGVPQLIAAVTPDVVERGLHAGDLVKKVGRVIGGGGGGRPTLAQAGGRDPERLDEALALVPQLVRDTLGLEAE
jgi:alanyl-tRNA synthetase